MRDRGSSSVGDGGQAGGPLRVLHLAWEYPPYLHLGGLGTAVAGLCRGLREAGHEPRVGLVSADPSCPIEHLNTETAPDGVRVTRIYPDRVAHALDPLLEFEPDLVHVHGPREWALGEALRAHTRTPLVFTAHGLPRVAFELTGDYDDWIELQEHAFSQADRVIAPCTDVARRIAGANPTVAGRLRVVGHGVWDAPAARAAVDARHPDDGATVLYCGRFGFIKGTARMAEAIPRLLERAPKARVIVAGCATDPPSASPFEGLARDDRVEVRNQWTTPDGIAALQARADILILPSHYETFSIALLEAMLHGMAVVAPDCGGPAEIVRHGETGLLFPPADTGAMVEALVRLAGDPDLHTALGRRAAAEVRRRWLWPENTRRMVDVYRELSAESSAAGARRRPVKQRASPKDDQPRWSIAVATVPDPLQLEDAASGPAALTAADVQDRDAEFVADPFLVRGRHLWHLFFEVLQKAPRKGSIGWATSIDGSAWCYRGIVLEESFHLSYPCVARDEAGGWIMVPETLGAGAIGLYRAPEPAGPWARESSLVQGRFADPTLFRHAGRWWLSACPRPKANDALCLWWADDLAGPWTAHAGNPVVRGDAAAARPGGRTVQWKGRLIRFAQDCRDYYGRALRAFEITRLSPDDFAQRELTESPVLQAGNSGWNADGMHHLDACPLPSGEWLAAVDGHRGCAPKRAKL